MLEGIRRWLGAPRGARASALDTGNVQPGDDLLGWAARRGASVREVPGEGFVVDGRCDDTPWRLEWGPSQRRYIAGHELRLRAAPGVAPEVHAALMTRRLAERLESEVYNAFVRGVQTHLDVDTPPEARWLALLPRLEAARLGPLRAGFVAVGNSQRWLGHWMGSPLPVLLHGALPGLLPGAGTVDEAPLMLSLTRGRLTLRTPLADPDPQLLQGWMRLFESALREARHAAEHSAADEDGPGTGSGGLDGDWPVADPPESASAAAASSTPP